MPAPRTREQNARRADHIAAFCAGVLADEGPAALRPSTIGQRMGSSGTSISNLFTGRAALLALVLDRHWDGLLAAAGQPADWPGDPRERLLAMATAYLERVGATRGVHAMLPECRPFLRPATRDDHAGRRRWLTDAFEAALADATPGTPRLHRALAETLLAGLDAWPAWSDAAQISAAEYAETAVGRLCGCDVGPAPHAAPEPGMSAPGEAGTTPSLAFDSVGYGLPLPAAAAPLPAVPSLTSDSVRYGAPPSRAANPYTPAPGAPPSELAGRDTLLAAADAALARVSAGAPAESLLLTGLRGSGKTVLLAALQDRAAAAGHHAARLDAPTDGALAPALVAPLRDLLARLSAGSGPDAAPALRRARRLLARVSPAPDPTAAAADPSAPLGALLAALAEAARAAGTPVTLLVNGLHRLSPADLSALVLAAHDLSRRRLPLLIFGAGLPCLPALSAAARPHAAALFRHPLLGALPPDDARAALLRPAARLGVPFAPDALDELLRVTGAHPFALQAWAATVWDRLDAPRITLRDIRRAAPDATARLDATVFRPRLDEATPAGRRYLHALAEAGTPCTSAAAALLLGKGTSAFGPVRDSLLRRALIWSPRRGVLEFTVPGFGSFLRRVGTMQ